jgi:hypothetical protein
MAHAQRKLQNRSGWSLNGFNSEFMDTLNKQMTLIIVDGRDNYNDPSLDIFFVMSHRSRGPFS